MERMDALFIAMWISSLVIKLAFDVNLFTGCAQHIKSGFKKWPGIAGGAVGSAAAIPPADDSAKTSAVSSPAALTVGSVALDPDRREVTVGGSPIVLTAREFDVLALLMAHAETVLTRERIAHEALGYEYVGDTNNVDVHIAHLRAKIEDAGGARIIQTVRGVGYVCRA